jgi:hypothetical protein
MFTNDDLKRLKEEMNPEGFTYNETVTALLARLEAAEAYINTPSGTCKNCDDLADETDEQKKAYQTWRASRGEAWDGEAWRKECGK